MPTSAGPLSVPNTNLILTRGGGTGTPPDGTFVPMVAMDFSTSVLGEPVTNWRESAISDITSVSGTKSMRLSTRPAGLPPTCGGSNYFAGRQALPTHIPVGNSVWQRMYMYFPSTFSFGYTFFVRDSTELTATANAGATKLYLAPSSETNWEEGTAVRVTLDDGGRHFTHIAVGGLIAQSEVIIEEALPSSATVGNTVLTSDKAEASECGKPADGNYTGTKWLVFSPNAGTRRIYQQNPAVRRQIAQGTNQRIQSEVGGDVQMIYAPIPLDQWVSFQMGVGVAQDQTGWIRFWLDDVLVAELTNLDTVYAPDGATELVSWGLGDYWNGLPWTDGGSGRTDFYIDEIIVASDLPSYGTPTGVDAAGNAFIDPATRAGDLV